MSNKLFIKVEFADIDGRIRAPRLTRDSAQRLAAMGFAQTKLGYPSQMRMRAGMYLSRDANGEYHPATRLRPAIPARLLDPVLRCRLNCESWERAALVFCVDVRDLYEPLLHEPLRAA